MAPMIFGFRKWRGPEGRASHPSAPLVTLVEIRRSVEWRSWRRAAQKVTRLWNEWLAADDPIHEDRYRRYLSALAEEERAAASLEHRLKLQAAADGERDRISLCTDDSEVETLHFPRTHS